MKIIQPATNIPAKDCLSWAKTKKEAYALRDFIKNGKFTGDYESAYAIAHAQVHDSADGAAPLNFFVVNEDKKYGFIKAFGSWCIMNPKIIQFADPVYIQDACMTFPHRKPKNTDRDR